MLEGRHNFSNFQNRKYIYRRAVNQYEILKVRIDLVRSVALSGTKSFSVLVWRSVLSLERERSRDRSPAGPLLVGHSVILRTAVLIRRQWRLIVKLCWIMKSFQDPLFMHYEHQPRVLPAVSLGGILTNGFTSFSLFCFLSCHCEERGIKPPLDCTPLRPCDLAVGSQNWNVLYLIPPWHHIWWDVSTV